ncbi:hypothetical protein [Psittacicella melopsittaci]|nr:hypothetical protein [Psittacicella melopsittaci]
MKAKEKQKQKGYKRIELKKQKSPLLNKTKNLFLKKAKNYN